MDRRSLPRVATGSSAVLIRDASPCGNLLRGRLPSVHQIGQQVERKGNAALDDPDEIVLIEFQEAQHQLIGLLRIVLDIKRVTRMILSVLGYGRNVE